MSAEQPERRDDKSTNRKHAPCEIGSERRDLGVEHVGSDMLAVLSRLPNGVRDGVGLRQQVVLALWVDRCSSREAITDRERRSRTLFRFLDHLVVTDHFTSEHGAAYRHSVVAARIPAYPAMKFAGVDIDGMLTPILCTSQLCSKFAPKFISYHR